MMRERRGFDGRRHFVGIGMLVHVHEHVRGPMLRIHGRSGVIKRMTREMVMLENGDEFQRRFVHEGQSADCLEGRLG